MRSEAHGVASARLYITALGLYEARLNGVHIAGVLGLRAYQQEEPAGSSHVQLHIVRLR
jgi:hypothetical protein